MLPKRKQLCDEIRLNSDNWKIGKTYVVRLKSQANVKFNKTIDTIKDIRNFKNGLFHVFQKDKNK